jgi:hypothetical protein
MDVTPLLKQADITRLKSRPSPKVLEQGMSLSGPSENGPTADFARIVYSFEKRVG